MECVVSQWRRMPLFPRLPGERSLRSGFCARYVLIVGAICPTSYSTSGVAGGCVTHARRSDNIEGVEIGYEIGCVCMRRRRKYRNDATEQDATSFKKKLPISLLLSSAASSDHLQLSISPRLLAITPQGATNRSSVLPAPIQNGRAADSASPMKWW